ncbi:hypothetical protein JXA84_05285, partial [candidate division WOR-3 bacterium]|nr:hypothetical protein [candidate division WOR-3 bacterium]
MARKKKVKNEAVSDFYSKKKTDILDFFHGDKKVFFLTGGPGSGKSRLLDDILHEVTVQELLGKTVRYDLNGINMIANPFDFLDFFSETLDDKYGLRGFHKGVKIIEKLQRLHDRYNAIDEMENHTLLTVVIDGLEKYPQLTTFLPPPNTWLRYLFSYRPHKLVQFWQNQISGLETTGLDLKNGDFWRVSDIVRPEHREFFENLIIKLKVDSPAQAGMISTALEICERKEAESCCSIEEIGVLISEKVKGFAEEALKPLLTLAICGFPVRFQFLSFIAGGDLPENIFKPFSGVLKTIVAEKGETLYEMDNWIFKKKLLDNCQGEIENIVSEFEDALISREKTEDSPFEEFCQKIRARWIWENLSKDRIYEGKNTRSSVFRFLLGTSVAPYQFGLASLAVEKNLGQKSRKAHDEKDLVSLLIYIEKIAESKNYKGIDVREYFSKIQIYKVDDIIETISNLSGLDDFKYYGLSVLSTLSLAVGDSNSENCDKKIDALFREIFSKLSEGIGDWKFFFSSKFMAYWTCELLKTQKPENVWKMLTLGAIETVEKDKMAVRVIDELIYSKNAEAAITLAEKLSDSEERSKKISEIALLVAKTGDPSEALKIIVSNEDIQNKPAILSIIAKKKASMGFFEESESLAQEIEELNEKFSALSFIAISYAERIAKGETGSLNRSLRIADQIKDVYLKNKTTAEIAVKISVYKLEEGLRILERIPADNHEMRSYAMSEISKILCLENKTQKALEIAENMPDNIYRSAAMSYIAKNLHQKGAKEKAFEIADKITFFGLRFQTLFQMSKDLSAAVDDTRPGISHFDKMSDENYVFERKFIQALISGDEQKALECVETFREKTEKIGLALKAINEGQDIPSENWSIFYTTLTKTIGRINPEKSVYLRILSLIACEGSKYGDVSAIVSNMAEKLTEKDFPSDNSKNMELLGEISKHLVVSLNQAMT